MCVGCKRFAATGCHAMANAIAKTIDDLRERGGLKGVDVANVTDVSKATVSRWTTGKAAPQPRTQLLLSDLRYVVDRLSEFYTPDETRTWLYSRNALLNGERAMDLIHEGRTEEVLLAIERLAALSYL
jgi:transcriptional regulator with XRE-family HTH domain